MQRINMNQWKEHLIEQSTVVALPVMTHPGIEWTGHTVCEAVCNGQIHYEAIRELCMRYPAAAATMIMDLTVEAEAFGAEIVFPENEVPSVVNRLLTNAEQITELEIPTLDTGRISEYLDAAHRAAAGVKDRPVLGGCIGPFSLAGRLYGLSEFMMLIYLDSEAAGALLEKCTMFITSYCEALCQTGIAGVLLAEPAAGLLSNDDCMTWSSQYVQRIVKRVQCPEFAVVLHNCGNAGHCTAAMVATRAWGYHFGNRIDMLQAAAGCPSDALIMGNIDPVEIFRRSSADIVYSTTRELIERMSDYPNFIISSGCDTPPGVPVTNIDAFYRAVDDYNTSR